MSEVERLRAALQRIADEYGDCRCEHDDENCCALVTDYCCPACIAAVALRETLPAAPPERVSEGKEQWLSIDQGPDGAGAQVWVWYPNPHHPDGGNMIIEWTPLALTTLHLSNPTHWMPLDYPKPPAVEPRAEPTYSREEWGLDTYRPPEAGPREPT